MLAAMQKNCTDTLRETMGSRIILDETRLPQVQGYHYATIEQTERACRREKRTQRHAYCCNESDYRLEQEKSKRSKYNNAALRKFGKVCIHTGRTSKCER